jgi:hypothetical protein
MTKTPIAADTLDPAIQRLLRPGEYFVHPRDVVAAPRLSREEKRAILSSWASDACAVESSPAFRKPPGASAPVSFDEIIDALRSLDDDEPPPRPGGSAMPVPWPLRAKV